MLKQRILTALVLLPLMLAMLFFAGNTLWAAFAALIVRPTVHSSGNDEGEPAFGYTFRRKGMPVIDRFEQNGGKTEYARYTDIRKVAAVGGACGFLFDKAV